ncbi:MAG TPA: methyltransferase [Rugosimonospora sp.]|nr:methyltransferase [Rugosimonospora sp.]
MPAARTRIDIQSVVRLSELADYIVPFTIRVICELGVADLLVAGACPVSTLAEQTGTHPPALLRMLRALACKGIFTEVEPEVFALTPLAEPLRGDHPLSLRAAFPLLACDIEAWAHFDHCVRTGEAAFDLAHGQGYWEYMAAHEDENTRFNASQQAATRLELRSILPVYPWQELDTLVDVGGGNGAFLAGILARFHRLRGTVFDLPHVVAEAPKVFADAGVAERSDAVGGSFLDGGVPEGADAYLLKRVLYHWDEERATTLLRNVRAAMRPDSRLLILEPVTDPVAPGEGYATGLLYDLLLLAMAGGGARSLDAISTLLSRAGLRLSRTLTTFTLPVLEVRPA